MYQALYNKDGSFKHSNECQMAFGRKDDQCPRCVEMLNGAPSRSGWQKGYYSFKAAQEAVEIEAVRNHSCKKSNCAPVCTFGDW